MKKSIISRSFALISSFSLTVFAALSVASSAFAAEECNPYLWREVRSVARACQRAQRAGHRCRDFRFFSQSAASFRMGKAEFRVTLFDSAYSDDGDLNDLIIQRNDGCRLERRNIPAYGDLLDALAHGS